MNIIGQDTIFSQLNNHTALLSVHLSNTHDELKEQVLAIEELIKKYPEQMVIVTGDFNCQLKKEGSKLTFLSKDIPYDQLTSGNIITSMHIPSRRIYLGDLTGLTTDKMRIITTQLPKMLDRVAAKIDWCFAVTPINTDDSYSITSIPMIMNKITKPNSVAPVTWCSDHFMVESEIINAGERLIIGTLNVLGESIKGEQSYGVFEFIDDIGLQEYNNNPQIADRILELRDQFIDKQISEISDDIVAKQWLTNHGINFDKKMNGIQDKALRREAFMDLKVFSKSLRSTDLMNIHCPSYGTGILRFKYDEELNKLKQKGDQEYKFAKRITDFYESLYNDPILKTFFTNWFNRVKVPSKKKFYEIVTYYLRTGKFDAFAIQEVSQNMRKKVIKLTPIFNKLGYEVVISTDTESKTTGVIFKKASSKKFTLTASILILIGIIVMTIIIFIIMNAINPNYTFLNVIISTLLSVLTVYYLIKKKTNPLAKNLSGN